LIIGFNAQESAFMAPMVMMSLKRGKTRFRDLFDVSAKSPEEVTLFGMQKISNLNWKKMDG